jgi:uncharacterized coiled-coil protein SlyX
MTNESGIDKRMRGLEVRMAVSEQCISDISDKLDGIPEAVTKLRELTSALSVQNKVTWALLSTLIISLIGVAIRIMAIAGMP